MFLKKVADRSGGRIDRINGMVKRGDYVFAANKAGWIAVFDVSHMEAPELFGALEVREKFGILAPHDIDVFGDYIVIIDPNGFGKNLTGRIAIFKVMDRKGRILPVDRWTLESITEDRKLIGANRVQVAGSFAYTAGSWTPSAREKQSPGKLGAQEFPKIKESKRTDNAHTLFSRNRQIFRLALFRFVTNLDDRLRYCSVRGQVHRDLCLADTGESSHGLRFW